MNWHDMTARWCSICFAAIFAVAPAAALSAAHQDVETNTHNDTLVAECLAVERAFATNNLEVLSRLQPEQPRWRVLRDFRLAAIYIPAQQKEAALKVVRRGLSTANRHLREYPEDVEMLLLSTMLDGQYLLVQRWRFLHNGLRGLRRLAAAEKLHAGNPRVALIRGTAKIVLPGILGGNTREAIELLAAAPISGNVCADGEWGQLDILTWLARAHDAQGNHDQAQQIFAQALQRDPDNHWVKLAMQGKGYRWEQPAKD